MCVKPIIFHCFSMCEASEGIDDETMHFRYHPSTPPHLPSALRRTSMQSPTTSLRSACSAQLHIAVPDFTIPHSEILASESPALSELNVDSLPRDQELQNNSVVGIAYPSTSEQLQVVNIPKRKDSLDRPFQITLRKSRKFKKGKKKRNSVPVVSSEGKDGKPPSYDSVLQQVLDEFYITDESYVIDDMKNNIGAQLRVRVAREKFQQLCSSTNGSLDEIYSKSEKSNEGQNSRKNTISPGTVKRRKARLLNNKRFGERKNSSTRGKDDPSESKASNDVAINMSELDTGTECKISACSSKKPKRSSIARNRSTPSLGNLISRDLEIYFSQKTPSPTNDDCNGETDQLFNPQNEHLSSEISTSQESSVAIHTEPCKFNGNTSNSTLNGTYPSEDTRGLICAGDATLQAVDRNLMYHELVDQTDRSITPKREMHTIEIYPQPLKSQQGDIHDLCPSESCSSSPIDDELSIAPVAIADGNNFGISDASPVQRNSGIFENDSDEFYDLRIDGINI